MPAVAITRAVSASFDNCELTHLGRVPINVDLARAQHNAYENALEDAGYRIDRLPAGADMPDAVFVEDAAIVFDELAIVTRPGAASRRAETAAVAEALSRYRSVCVIQPPGTMDGGDVIVIPDGGRRVFVGVSTRTNLDAIAQMRRMLAPYGYSVVAVQVGGCLHLKSAATCVAEDVLLINPEWLPTSAFPGFDFVTVDEREPAAANAVRLRDRLIAAAAFPRTAERLMKRGWPVVTVDVSEIAKAEGAVTCCSLIIESSKSEV